jgi:hypothetical protein
MSYWEVRFLSGVQNAVGVETSWLRSGDVNPRKASLDSISRSVKGAYFLRRKEP